MPAVAKLALIGVGLIGGSLAAALKQAGTVAEIAGWSPGDDAAVARALALEHNVVVAHVAEGPAFDAIRISVHPSNQHAQLDRCANALRSQL